MCLGSEPSVGLYAPLLPTPADRPLVFAHLAQSLDGFIALPGGSSQWLSGPCDLDHTHRLRALSDAVLIGANTAALDNPRLTVRRVEGKNPIRLVLDPQLRLDGQQTLFHDSAARTIILCAKSAVGSAPGQAELLRIEEQDGQLPPQAILSALAGLGLKRLMVEGGGITISRFLNADCLDRLHLVVAPVLLGQGRSSVVLPPLQTLDEAPRPHIQRWKLGEDTLFDCDFAPSPCN